MVKHTIKNNEDIDIIKWALKINKAGSVVLIADDGWGNFPVLAILPTGEFVRCTPCRVSGLRLDEFNKIKEYQRNLNDR